MAIFLRGVGQQVLKSGQQEGRGLAGARMRLPRDILPVEGNGHGFSLDRSAEGEPGVLDALHDFRGESETVESYVCQVFFTHSRLGYSKYPLFGLAKRIILRSNT